MNLHVLRPLFFFAAFLGASFSLSAQTTAKKSSTPTGKPNILLFLVDDMGWQDTSLPFYHDKSGKEVRTPLNNFYKTPSMEKLASQGMKFTQAYAAPVCSPTRVSLMTGKMPATHRVSTWTALHKPLLNDERKVAGMRGPEWKMDGIPLKDTPLPALLSQAGYKTISVGKAHFAPNTEKASDPKALGFDVNIAGNGLGGPGSYRSDQNFVKGNPGHQVPGMEKYWTKNKNASPEELKQNFLTQALTTEMKEQITQASKEKRPFFAYMTHYAVHSTHEDPDPNGDYNSYDQLPVVGDKIQTQKNYLKNYATLIEGMDQSLGQLIEHLKSLGIAENTLIIFASDNGGDSPIQQSYGGNLDFINQVGSIAPLRARKGSCYEGGTRVPLIIAWAAPNKEAPLQKAYPIALGTKNDHIVALWDLYPTLASLAKAPIRHKIDGVNITDILCGAPEKKIRREQNILQHFPHSHTYGRFYSTYREGDWKVIYHYDNEYLETGKPAWELFNLKDDISESHNLAADPAQRTRLLQLAQKLDEGLKSRQAQYPLLLDKKNPDKILGEARLKLPK